MRGVCKMLELANAMTMNVLQKKTSEKCLRNILLSQIVALVLTLNLYTGMWLGLGF